jgi:hypothetical protein
MVVFENFLPNMGALSSIDGHFSGVVVFAALYDLVPPTAHVKSYGSRAFSNSHPLFGTNTLCLFAQPLLFLASVLH